MRLLTLGLAAAATMLAAAPAAAATLRFDVGDPDAINGVTQYHFFLDSDPDPFYSDAHEFRLAGTDYYHDPVFGDYSSLDTYSFYTSAVGGGFDDDEDAYEGDVLFTGTTDNPAFRLGTFALNNFGSGATLTISAVAAPVPEPATWAAMLAGFGLTGAALRRRPLARPGTAV